MTNKTCTICRLCDKKVKKYDNNTNGFMEVCNHEYHFVCVEKYGYQKFCKEVMEYIEETNNDKKINNPESSILSNQSSILDSKII